MLFEINPYVGAGLIKFGMKSDEISQLLISQATRFNKYEETETDAFEWCHVYYKGNGECEAIEFFEPAHVTFIGESLLGRTFRQVKEIFQRLDSSIEVDETGLTSYLYGIGLYAPFISESLDEPVEGVIVFEKGYYD